jgi:ribonuclease P protein component
VAPRTVGRITSRTAFAEVQRARARGACGPVRAAFAPVDEATPGVFPQVGYAIGRRCGSAVVRNRLRRRARAVVREAAPSLPRGAFLVRLEPAASSLSAAQLRHDLSEALRRAGQAAERP